MVFRSAQAPDEQGTIRIALRCSISERWSNCPLTRRAGEAECLRRTRTGMTDAEEIRRRREELKQRYGVAYQRVSNILFTEDPIGINFEDNTDEYEPEVGTILPRLRDCRSVDDVGRIVHEEFVQWFGVAIAGPPEKYRTAAKRMWKEVVPGLTR